MAALRVVLNARSTNMDAAPQQFFQHGVPSKYLKHPHMAAPQVVLNARLPDTDTVS